jgi:ABC-type nitrate/sulfonate/bicarbonate transport system permease component
VNGLRRHAVFVGRAVVPLVLLGSWSLAAALSDLVAPVGASVSALLSGFADGSLWPDVSDTLRSVLAGFAVAVVLGIPFGVWVGRSPYLYRVLESVFSGTAAVPRIVLLPVLLTLFGITIQAKIGMAFLGAIVPIALTTMAGTRTVRPTLLKLGRSLSMSRRVTLLKVIVPSALASIMSGLRIGFSLSLLTVVLSEFFAAVHGVGLRIQQAYSSQDLPLMYGLVALVIVFGLVANIGIWLIERRTVE